MTAAKRFYFQLITPLGQSLPVKSAKGPWNMYNIGSAIYPTLALLNHSCDPNVMKFFRGSEVVVVAKRNIYKDEEVTENYFPCYALIPKPVRQAWLYDHYFFHCLCLACESDYPLFKDLTERRFRCPKCKIRGMRGAAAAKIRVSSWF